jgi:hypothetical protein
MKKDSTFDTHFVLTGAALHSSFIILNTLKLSVRNNNINYFLSNTFYKLN